jgi:Txe/YoeB family toxin of Txe-Axe toxin-antitoxin module
MRTVSIITYPRSGAHYLQNLILNRSSQHIGFSHKTDKPDDLIITIARDPFESIHSYVTMQKHYHANEYYEKRYNNDYINMYEFLNKNADIVIDYKDLINSPRILVGRVCDMLKYKKVLNNEPMVPDNKDLSYLVSSKTSFEYNNKHFDIKDIEDCYEPYNRLLLKAIDLNKPLS